MNIRLAGIKRNSVVDGPGIRFSLYVQGCSHRCKGCHNPDTHDPNGGYIMSVRELGCMIKAENGINGVTISGGEPFEQSEPLAALIGLLERGKYNLVYYSGYTFEHLLKLSVSDWAVEKILLAGWLLIDGPFIFEQRRLTVPYRGSLNQRIINLPISLQKGRPVCFNEKYLSLV